MNHSTKTANAEGVFDFLYDQTPAMMHSVDIDGNIIHVSDFWLNKLGYDRDEVLHKNFIDFLIDSEKEHAIKVTIPDFYTKGSSENVPYKMKCKDGKVLEVLLTSASIRDNKGNYKKSNAVLTDVTQSNILKNELEKTQKLLYETHSMAKVGAWEVNLLTNETFLSDVTKMIMEIPESFEAKGDEVAAFYKEGESREKFISAVEKAISQGISYDFESELITAKENEIWARSIGNIEFKNGAPYRMYGSFQDITGRKKAEIKILKSEKKYKSLFNSFSDIYYRTDDENNVIAISPSVEKHYGYKVEELIGMKSDALVVNKSQVNDLRKVISKRGKINNWVTEVLTQKGEKLTVSVNIVANYDKAGIYKGLTGVIKNITEKVKSDVKISTLLHRYEQLFQNSNDAIIISDYKTNDIIDANLAAEGLLGYTKLEFKSMNLIDLSKSGIYKKINDWHKKITSSKQLTYETQIRNKEQKILHVEINAKIVKIDRKKVVQCFVKDITSKKRIEGLITTSQINLKKAERLTKMGNWEYNTIEKSYYFSDEISNIFEVNKNEKISFKLIKSSVHPNDFISFKKHVKRHAKENFNTTFSYRIIINGKVKYLDSVNESYYNEGIVIKIFGTIQDVTKSRLLENQLHKKNTQLKVLSKIEKEIFQAKNITNLSNQVSNILIKELDLALVQIKLPSSDGSDILLPIAQKMNLKFTEGNLDWLNNPRIKKPQDVNSKGAKFILINDITLIHKPKTWKNKSIENNLMSYISFPFSFKNTHQGVVDIYMNSPFKEEEDIGFLKQIVADLAVGLNSLELNKEKEELTGYNKMLVESLNLVSFEMDALNDKIEFRGNTHSVLGYTVDELGNSLSEFNSMIHPYDLTKIRNQIKHLDGNQIEIEYRFEQTDGTYTWVNSIDRIIKSKKNELITVSGIILNIDTKKNDIKNHLAAEVKGKDLERKRIAEELHDSLGQTLSVASMSLNAIRNDVTFSNPLNQGIFTNVQSLVDQAITDTREISHNLIPSALMDFGLIPSLEADILKLNSISKIQFYFYHHNVSDKLNDILEVNIYKIIKEGINNIIKHSKAKTANIQVMIHEKLLVVMIEDDGIGFDKAIMQNYSGIGLQNIRNRVKSIGGEIFIENLKGVLITIEIQL